MGGRILPLSLMDEAIGSQVWVILKNKREFLGTLHGFDDYVNMVLDDVTEYEYDVNGDLLSSNTLKQTLLNHGDVCLICPGAERPAPVQIQEA